jgi:hypothetical protein
MHFGHLLNMGLRFVGFFVPWQEDSLRKKMRARRVVVGL